MFENLTTHAIYHVDHRHKIPSRLLHIRLLRRCQCQKLSDDLGILRLVVISGLIFHIEWIHRKHHTAGYVSGRIFHASEYAVFGLRTVLKPLCISFYPGAILFFSRLIIQEKSIPAKPVGICRRTGRFLHHLLQLLLFRFRGQGIPCSASLQNHDRKLLNIMILCYIF